MSQETNTIKVSRFEVDIIKNLTWGQYQDLEDVLINGAKVGSAGLEDYEMNVIRKQKYKLLEISIKEIREGEKKINFSKEWMDGLPMQDGTLLYDTIEKMTKKK